ncbi:MAG: twin-arginine translocation signal domain-containing protein [Actinomycetota bacterium]|nr:twin-arginine translocation signal domain-containing protein [Actinomycetota bacterium]
MAITRRQFVTRLSALAAAAGLGQSDLSQVTQAFAHWNAADASGLVKPKVIWVHGAECTGCSTSALGLLEDYRAEAVPGTGISTAAALTAIAVNASMADPDTTLTGGVLDDPHGHRTLDKYGLALDGTTSVTIADVLIDFIDLKYHETIMGMGGDLAAKYLWNEYNNDGTDFILVVEGAVQPSDQGGYWGEDGSVPWCSIAATDTGHELAFDEVVETLATRSECLATLALGQCATYGGYPGCVGSGLVKQSDSDSMSQTGALGVYDFLKDVVGGGYEKVVNVPGCPVNPWWFVLTVVLFLHDLATSSGGALIGTDTSGRLSNVYSHQLHGRYCPWYADYALRDFAAFPGDDGCMKEIGCKGLYTMTTCGIHGWNGMQGTNAKLTLAGNAAADLSLNEAFCGETPAGEKTSGNCLKAGSPCMGCTEKGYPDRFVPFVIR